MLLGNTILRSKLIFCSCIALWPSWESEQAIWDLFEINPSTLSLGRPAQFCKLGVNATSMLFPGEAKGRGWRWGKGQEVSGEEKQDYQLKIISKGSKSGNSSKAGSYIEEKSIHKTIRLLPSPETHQKRFSGGNLLILLEILQFKVRCQMSRISKPGYSLQTQANQRRTCFY